MTRLNRTVFVACPLFAAPGHLDRYLRENSRDGRLQLALRAPIKLPGLHTEIVLQRDVIATVEARAENRPGYKVTWRPADDGPFPRFEGTLSIDADEDWSCCNLSLDGSYEPPLRVAGNVFDAILGHRIAQATAGDLLARIGASMEAWYRASEATKARVER